jgi:hypothetical protein
LAEDLRRHFFWQTAEADSITGDKFPFDQLPAELQSHVLRFTPILWLFEYVRYDAKKTVLFFCVLFRSLNSLSQQGIGSRLHKNESNDLFKYNGATKPAAYPAGAPNEPSVYFIEVVANCWRGRASPDQEPVDILR